jgi:D-alanyl-D-alanine carboxypeptidase
MKRGLVCLGILLTVSAVAAPSLPAADAEKEFRAVLIRALQEHHIPGLSVAIATRQGVVWTGTVGVANLTSKAPAHAGYLYGIGSITKTFVACLVERLIDEGRLSEDTRLLDVLGAETLRGIPNASEATIGQLLNHSSGIATWEMDADWIRVGRGAQLDPEKWWGKSETLEFLREDRHPATNPPGVGFAYSNTNYTLLGLVLERVTGRAMVTLLHHDLLDPLGLKDIRLEGFEPIDGQRVPGRYHYGTAEFLRTAGRAAAFREVGNGLLDVSRSNLSTEWTAGGLLATAHDLAAFTLALRDGQVVSAAALQRMTHFSSTGEADEEVGQGLFREKMNPGWLIGYDGGVLGFGAVMGWFEQGDVVIALMANVGMMHAGDAAWFPLQLVRSAAFVHAAQRLAMHLTPPLAPVPVNVH